MEFQRGKCGVCSKDLKRDLRACIDHDHATGLIRGLLCSACNSKLGFIESYLSDKDRWDYYLQNTPISQIVEGKEKFYDP